MSHGVAARLAALPQMARRARRATDVLIATTIAALIVLVGWVGTHAVNRLEELRQAPHYNMTWTGTQIETSIHPVRGSARGEARPCRRAGAARSAMERIQTWIHVVSAGSARADLPDDPEFDADLGAVQRIDGEMRMAVAAHGSVEARRCRSLRPGQDPGRPGAAALPSLPIIVGRTRPMRSAIRVALDFGLLAGITAAGTSVAAVPGGGAGAPQATTLAARQRALLGQAPCRGREPRKIRSSSRI